MNSVFITGQSTAGKSTLAVRLAETLGMTCVKTDAFRREMMHDPVLKPWVNFFRDRDEAQYWRTTSPEQHWQNYEDQFEAFWPTTKKNIEEILASGKPTVFEGTNLLPHLMRELPLRGIVLLNDSEEQILKHLRVNPRWGETEELQRMEAHANFTIERIQYKTEADKYGYKTFSKPETAESELIKLIQEPS
jgi:2-phosphoglycerate kinase